MGNDFLDGDFSFRNFFKIMWQNNYIQLFAVFLTIFIIELFKFNWCIDLIASSFSDGVFGGVLTILGVLLFPAGTFIITFKVMQFWNDLKQGKSR